MAKSRQEWMESQVVASVRRSPVLKTEVNEEKRTDTIPRFQQVCRPLPSFLLAIERDGTFVPALVRERATQIDPHCVGRFGMEHMLDKRWNDK